MRVIDSCTADAARTPGSPRVVGDLMFVNFLLSRCVMDSGRLCIVGIICALSFELIVKVQHEIIAIPDDAEVTVTLGRVVRDYSQS